MGTWAYPDSVEKAESLARLMEAPLPASEAIARLGGLIGDDSLFDSIDNLVERNPEADVRAYVAVQLDEWLNWMTDDSWMRPLPPGVRDVFARILDDYRENVAPGVDVAALFPFADADKALAEVARVLDEERPVKELRGRWQVVPVIPGVHAVVAGGELLRHEGVWNVVVEAEPELRERLERALGLSSPASPAP